MEKPTATTITLAASRGELLASVADPDRQPVLITLGRDDEGNMDLTLATTAPDGPATLEYLGRLLTSIGQGLTAQAHTLTLDADEETDQ